jgi:ferredoxin
MKISVDQHRCIGAGQCVRTAPEVFDQREADGIVTLIVPEPDDALRPKIEKAAKLCPSQSIRVDPA